MTAAWRAGLGALALALAGGCAPERPPPAPEAKAEMPAANPFAYVEIPVADLDRAMRFYGAVFGHDFERQEIDGYPMALFPFDPAGPGATGALAQGDVYVPARTGPIVYMNVEDIAAVLERAEREGGEVLYPRTALGELGYVAEIGDSEGNRIGLRQTLP